MTSKVLVVLAAVCCGAIGGMGTANAQTPNEPANSNPAAERELEQAKKEMVKARAQLEAGARTIARLSTRDFPGPNVLFLSASAELGINIEDAEGGALVIGVTPGSTAADAGVKVGDLIVAVDDVDVNKPEASRLIVDHLRDVEPGNQVKLRIMRGGKRQELSVEAREGGPAFFARQPGTAVFAPRGRGNFNVFPFDFSGRWRNMELAPLSKELGSYFGTTEGLLVVRAPGDDALRLADGDVILDIGGRKPTSPEHAMRILGSFEPGETLRMTIMRHQRRQMLEYTIPKNGGQ